MGVKVTIDHPECVAFARENRFKSEDANYGQAYVEALAWLNAELDLNDRPSSESRDHALMTNWFHSGHYTLEQRLRDGDGWSFGAFTVQIEMYEES